MPLGFFASVLKSHTNRWTLALQDACDGIDLSGWCSHPARRELGPHPLNPLRAEVRFSPKRHISPAWAACGLPGLAAPEVAFHSQYAILISVPISQIRNKHSYIHVKGQIVATKVAPMWGSADCAATVLSEHGVALLSALQPSKCFRLSSLHFFWQVLWGYIMYQWYANS